MNELTSIHPLNEKFQLVSEGSVSYEEALAIVEKFMQDTGIREFCERSCEGKCCLNCYLDLEERCYITDDRNLFCSAFVCDRIEKAWSKAFGYSWPPNTEDIREIRGRQMSTIQYSCRVLSYTKTNNQAMEKYGVIHTKEERDSIRVPLEFLWLYRYGINIPNEE